ncbi:TenA family protein [Mycobacterium sp. 050134]|uniref:TenA family protein n=1 Tax=Mycobacterium sp. 050134 TaxID=3096111 RepID=UPI002ED917F0
MGSLLEECISAAGPAWTRYENHPWFQALEQGLLPIERFVHFQLDDAPFIPYLHQTVALALAKAPVGSKWSHTAAKMLSQVFVANELATKKEILEALGVRNPRFDRWALSPRREAYANHLVRVALEGTTAETAAALLPCTFFTRLVGRRFESVEIPGPEAYRRWARIYADKQMYQMLEAHEQMMEDEVAREPSRREHLVRLFVRSTQHQVAVFDDALNPGQSWPTVALSDFQPQLTDL